MKFIRLIFKVLLVLLVLIIITGDFYFKTQFYSYDNAQKEVLIIAHRGASGQAPENTLAAVKLALEQKADMVEIDVFLTKDNELVVLHDETIDRTTNGQGKVETMTLEEVKKLDAGSWFSAKYKGVQVPTLGEVLKLVNGKAQLLIEIKKSGRSIVQKVTEEVQKHQADAWCVIQSFDPKVAANLQKIGSKLEKHQLVLGNFPLYLPLHYNKKMGSGSIYQYKQVQAINSMYLFTNRSVIDKIHHQKQKIFVWTVNRPKDLERLMRMGVDGIITDYPAKALNIRNKVLGK